MLFLFYFFRIWNEFLKVLFLQNCVDGMDDAVAGDEIGVDDGRVNRRGRYLDHRTLEYLFLYNDIFLMIIIT